MNSVIHVLEPEPDGEIGGADLHVLDLCSGLKKRRRFSPYVLINQSTSYARQLRKAEIRFYHGHRFRFSKYELLAKIKRLPKLLDACIVHSHGYDANYITWLLRHLYPQEWGELRFVATCHGWVVQNPAQRLKTFFDYKVCAEANALIVCSEGMIEGTPLRAFKGIVTHIPNGIRIENRLQSVDLSPGGNATIGVVGRLAPEKRPLLAIEVIARLTDLGMPVAGKVIGTGPLSDAVRRHVEELGLQGVVSFQGLTEERKKIYEGLSLLLHTSNSESTSRVILEAMCFGVPVVASRIPGNEQVISHGVDGMLADPSDRQQYVSAIRQLLENGNLRAQIIAAARKKVLRKFSIDGMVRQTEDLYAHLLDG